MHQDGHIQRPGSRVWAAARSPPDSPLLPILRAGPSPHFLGSGKASRAISLTRSPCSRAANVRSRHRHKCQGDPDRLACNKPVTFSLPSTVTSPQRGCLARGHPVPVTSPKIGNGFLEKHKTIAFENSLRSTPPPLGSAGKRSPECPLSSPRLWRGSRAPRQHLLAHPERWLSRPVLGSGGGWGCSD